jgi:hypothetical protein
MIVRVPSLSSLSDADRVSVFTGCRFYLLVP